MKFQISVRERLGRSPAVARVVPFALFLILTTFQGFSPEAGYWMYAAKTLIGAALIWVIWPLIPEMRWRVSWLAVAAGVAVFVLWVGLDPFYPQKKPTSVWNPFQQFPDAPALAWFFVSIRILGSTLVVPPLEEVFYRSFVYRYIVTPDFLSVPLRLLNWKALLITSVIFGVTHFQWLPGILCGLIYQGVVIRTGRLGDAITAHAVTNLLLGCWVLWRNAWQFW